MKIGSRVINTNEKPFIIAEAGINHNGDIETAFKMIETAKEIGVDAVKFQTFKAEEFNVDNTTTYTYYSQGKEITESMLQMFKRYEFSFDEWKQIKRKCDDVGIMFLSTPQNYSDLELLIKLGISAIKVGSDDFTNIPLLEKFASKNLPMILSCGMADLGEIYCSLETVEAFDRDDIALLLCTSEYPTPYEDVNLNKLKTLHSAFPELPLGFSDHTQGSLASGTAVALNARIFEKHFTLDRNMEGPDHWFSENPISLAEWKKTILEAWKLLGSSLVRPTLKEKEMRSLARRSIYTIQDIEQGEILTENNLGMFRPGDGLMAKELRNIIGKRAKNNISRGHKLNWGDLC